MVEFWASIQRWQPVRVFLIALVMAAAPQAVRAQVCSFTITGLAFGAVNTTSGLAYDSTATLTASCLGVLGDQVMVCPHFGAGSGGGSGTRTMTGPGSLEYQMYSDPARTQVWGGTNWLGSPPKISFPLTVLGTYSTTIYGRVFAGQSGVPTGGYSSSMAGYTNFRYRYDNGQSCGNSGFLQPLSQPSFTITATVLPNCQVSASPLNFGTLGLLDAAADASTSLSVTCPSSTAYTVSLGPGSAGSGPTSRKMAKGSEFVTYGLFRDSNRTQPWGNTTGTTLGGSGSGTAQSIPVYGRVPAQDTPSAGAYSDTVVVTVTY